MKLLKQPELRLWGRQFCLPSPLADFFHNLRVPGILLKLGKLDAIGRFMKAKVSRPSSNECATCSHREHHQAPWEKLEKLGQPDLKWKNWVSMILNLFQPTNTEAGRSVPFSIFLPPSLDDRA